MKLVVQFWRSEKLTGRHSQRRLTFAAGPRFVAIGSMGFRGYRSTRFGNVVTFSVVLLLAAFFSSPSPAATFDEANEKYLAGHYAEAAELAAEQTNVWNERWPRLLIKCQMALGRYPDAQQTYLAAIKRYPTSLTLRLQGREVLRANGLQEQAEEADQQILLLLRSSNIRFAGRDSLIAAGRYLAERGEDAKQILNTFYDRVTAMDPNYIEAYVATAELALGKGDYKVAAETLQRAQRTGTNDPRIAYLLARAWESSDAEKATEALRLALAQNPYHVPSLLYQAEEWIDRERYDTAEHLIDRALCVNPKHQEAWALLAVIAHLRGKFELEKLMREAALSSWADNPRVDHLIGRKLSQKYRFAEGAAYQRRALQVDASYVPAVFQLAQDNLRLGEEEIGWGLAEMVSKEDPYNVVAHNLLTLNDRLKKFTLLEAEGIRVRMDAAEASIYGDAVLALLTEAKQVLCDKYEVHPTRPIVVEIFPEQKDFAIRTFGLPGGAGFLGVCFGRVITANSPASQGERPSNWQSVLWHEFCHVVTLEKTKNRMPRWLSEGISVYEERQRDPTWGERMSPEYREMLLSDDLTPVSQLSGAFLNPPSPLHLQFAYFESSLVVEFLIENHGLDAVKRILDSLGDGLTINDALELTVGSLAKLDSQFAAYARETAKAFGPQADWSRSVFGDKPPTVGELQAWITEHPDNYWAHRALAEVLIKAGRHREATAPLEKLRELKTTTGSQNGPLERLAFVYQRLGDQEAEQRTLREIVARSADALPALRRSIELSRQTEDWEAVQQHAEKLLAIHPLIPDGHAALAEAGEKLDQADRVVSPLRALAKMNPVDPAGIDYRLAEALAALNQPSQARHHLLRALDEAPRYRAALRLLLKLQDAEVAADPPPTDDESERRVNDSEQQDGQPSADSEPQPPQTIEANE